MTHAYSAPDLHHLSQLADDLIRRAKARGAEACEVSISETRSLDVGVREGKLEEVERSESRDAGLRVFIGQRQAGVAFSDLSEAGIDLVIERALAMAKAAPEDPYCGLVARDKQAKTLPEIALYDPVSDDPAALEEAALRMEAAAMGVEGVAMIGSSSAGESLAATVFMTSTGFHGTRLASQRGLGVAAIAKNGDAMERDYDQDTMRRAADLKSPDELGRSAGERAARRLGSDKMPSGKKPVIFDNRISTTFIGSLLGAISGPAIARGTSFLRDKLGQQVLPEGLDLIEDPLKDWGHGSRAFDGEGVATYPTSIVEDGILTTWLHNSASARQLGQELTGHAARNLGAPPGVRTSNVHLSPGEDSLDSLITSITDGLYITEMFGPSLNGNTGDWSVGVSGLRIENGILTHPVSEVTVAGNMIEILLNLVPANDLDFRHATNSPSVYVDTLAIGGR
ncbi:TldD/PmbA family protein [Woodsholea maritima]|uniref:TldD/PmbA family protein n=1 Tax=Woodsholea maritima TaxID=240237 RepID=UPI00037DE363|nr:TldD/PmbA family protein [Woodsholea maritima]